MSPLRYDAVRGAVIEQHTIATSIVTISNADKQISYYSVNLQSQKVHAALLNLTRRTLSMRLNFRQSSHVIIPSMQSTMCEYKSYEIECLR